MLKSTKGRNVGYHLLTYLLIFSFILLPINVYAGKQNFEALQIRDQAYAAQQTGNFQNALGLYLKVLSLGLETANVFNDIGVLYEQLGMPRNAKEYYLRAIAEDEKYLPSYLNMAYLYKKNGQIKDSAEYFLKRYELAGLGDPWAEKAKQELLLLDPNFEENFLHNIAQNLSKELSEELVESARQIFARNVELAHEHYEKGNLFFQENRFQDAKFEYETALKVTPGNPKIMKAKQKLELKIASMKIQEYSDFAVKMLSEGNVVSARAEIQKMFLIIPSDTQ